MDKQQFILEVCRNGVHAPTAGYIYENIREIQMLKERVEALEAKLDEKVADKIANDPELDMVLDEEKKPKTKKSTKNTVKSVEKSTDDY